MAKIQNMPTQGGRSCTKGLHRKVWNLKPFHTLFCRDIKICGDIKICRDLRSFQKFLGKKVFYWVKSSVSWATSGLLHGIYCILYWINFASLQIRAKKTYFSQDYQIGVRRQFLWPFLLSPKGCQLLLPCACIWALFNVNENMNYIPHK